MELNLRLMPLSGAGDALSGSLFRGFGSRAADRRLCRKEDAAPVLGMGKNAPVLSDTGRHNRLTKKGIRAWPGIRGPGDGMPPRPAARHGVGKFAGTPGLSKRIDGG